MRNLRLDLNWNNCNNLLRLKKCFNLQVDIFALSDGVEGAAEALVRLANLEDVGTADQAALPPTLQHQVAAIRHHLKVCFVILDLFSILPLLLWVV